MRWLQDSLQMGRISLSKRQLLGELSAVITQLDLRGVGFDAGMQFVRRFLGAMQWNP